MGTAIEDLNARARQLLADGEHRDAVKACRRYLLTKPDDVAMRLLLGRGLLALGRHDEVRAEMRAVLRAAPREGAAHRLLGEAYHRDGQTDKARQHLEKALEMDANDREAQALLGQVGKGRAPRQSPSPSPARGAPARPAPRRRPETDDAPTVQAPNPPVREEDTPPHGQSDPVSEPSVQFDPSFTEEIRAKGGSDPEPPTRSIDMPKRPSSKPPRGKGSSPPKQPDFGAALEQGTVAHTPIAIRSEGHGQESPPATSPRPSSPPKSAPPRPADPGRSNKGPSNKGRSNKVRSDEAPAKKESPLLEAMDPAPEDLRAAQEAFDEQPTMMRPSPAEAPFPYHPGGPPPHDWNPDDEATRVRVPGAPMPPGPPVPGPQDLQAGPPAGFAPPADAWGAGQAPAGAPPAATPRSEPPVARPSKRPPERTPITGSKKPPSKGRGRTIALAAVAAVVVGVGGVFAARTWLQAAAREDLKETATRATTDGLQGSFDEAIALAEDLDATEAETLALEARLLATAMLEHGAEHGERIRALLGELGGDGAALTDARVARAYLSLAEGDVDGARAEVAAAGGETPEVWRARAMTAAAAGELEEAVAAARDAVRQSPDSPRHTALLALLLAAHGDAGTALEKLDEVPGAEGSPAVRIARARILQESGRDPVRAVAEATAVLDELGAVASPPEKAWAHLVRARQAVEAGEERRALTEAQAAAASRPSGHEGFALSLAEVFLRVGASDEAREVLSSLPSQSVEPERRAQLVAEVSIDAGDYDAAEAALANAGQGPATDYLRGRLHEARGQLDEAKRLYERAAEDPREMVRARTRLGAVELARGNPGEAVEILDGARERAPADLELVPMLVQALLAENQTDRASEVVETALQMHEGAPELLAAKARVELAKGNTEAALSLLQEVTEQRPDDAELQVALGDAARAGGDVALARASYDKALELREGHQAALLGLAQLAIDQGDADAAAEALDRAREQGAAGLDVDRAQAQLMVLRGEGQAATEQLRNLAEGSDSAALWASLGRAYTQAERDREAEQAFDKALELDEGNPEALLGMAFIETRAGQLGRVARNLGEAERIARERDLGPRFDARIAAARGRLRFELGDFAEARSAAEEALEKDERSSEAYLLLANINQQRGNDPTEFLKKAAEGRAPLPEAIGRYAVRAGASEETCQLARTYMERAPRGYDASDVRELLEECE